MKNEEIIKNEEVQKQLYRLEVYKQQLNRLQEELGRIELLKLEILKSIASMEGLKQSKEVLLPLGGGTFAKAVVEDNDKVIINTGVDIFVEKSVDDAIKDFKETCEELEKAENKIKEQMAKTLAAIQQLQKELESKISVMEKEQASESS